MMIDAANDCCSFIAAQAAYKYFTTTKLYVRDFMGFNIVLLVWLGLGILFSFHFLSMTLFCFPTLLSLRVSK